MVIAIHPAATFGTRLYEALIAETAAFPQRELAAALGISQSAVSQRLSSPNMTIARAEELLLACEALGSHAPIGGE